MEKAWQNVVLLLSLWAVGSALSSTAVVAQLSPKFYQKTCPDVFKIVGKGVYAAIKNESRIAASLLRLHFHDCFVQGCDASVLLDNTTDSVSEFYAPPNFNSLRGFDVIDSIKASLEQSCPGVVSCADTVALASFFSIVLSGGPKWAIPLGRRDSFTSAFALTVNLPGPNSDINTLKGKFSNVTLNTRDLVALSGGHTIGLSRCVSLQTRLYNFNGTGKPDPSLPPAFQNSLDNTCPNGGNGEVTAPMDIETPTVFDNLYFKNLLNNVGIFTSDRNLLNGGPRDTAVLVNLYAANQTKFFIDFADSMKKMGNLNVSTGTAGEVRKNCHVRNSGKGIEEEITQVVEEIFEGEEQLTQTPLEKLVEDTEEVLENAVDYIRDVVDQVKAEIRREEFHKLTVENTLRGGHSSM